VIRELAETADIVLIDTPPCLIYSDAFVISHLVDGVLYVLRAGAQNKTAQRRVHRQLEQSKARLLGVVFNGVDVQDGSAANDYYGYQPNGRHAK
jgi:Mrp family chromosome partitioning ATPase